ncbi:carbohydrate ABC transporter permease [Gayadomonas joobiniege]|uniref:carbohydrate ABC transporter permease n=1 Tax=Gayadomonas joobiniege TaxID=1234606 RepID=UPI00036C6732|nr:sugar ABC transporter permease [Gayadomonas joobiniege]
MRSLNFNLLCWLLLAPLVASLSLFIVYAFGKTIWYSLQSYNLFNAPNWVGLNNFAQLMFDEVFWQASINTLLMSTIGSIIQISAALFIALSLHKHMHSHHFYREILYLPALFSSAALTVICLFLIQSEAVYTFLQAPKEFAIWFISTASILYVVFQLPIKKFKAVVRWSIVIILLILGYQYIPAASMKFTSNPLLSSYQSWLGLSPPLWLIIIQNSLLNVPMYCLLLFCALNSIPSNLYQAAACDGASRAQMHQWITLPLLEPLLLLLLILSLISGMQTFEQVFFLGSAVPIESKLTLAQYIYQHVFPANQNPSAGIASAAAVVMFLFILTLIVWPLKRLLKHRSLYASR